MPRESLDNCIDCGNFNYSKGTDRRFGNRCRDCFLKRENERQKAWTIANPERRKQIVRKKDFKKAYGITEDLYNAMVTKHLGGCAICKQPCSTGKNLCVDHNHETGEIRGLLCRKCNMVIGLLNESEDLIWNMLEYLKRTTWNKEVAS